MTMDLKGLIEKLNPVCRRALETAAGRCVAQTHYNVEVEHFLLELLEAEGTDLRVVLRYYEVDRDSLAKELTGALDGFRRGSSRTPAMSPQLPRLLQQAWLVSSVELGAPTVRSGAVLKALVEGEEFRQIVVDSCPGLTALSLDRLQADLPDLLPHSDEERATVGGSGRPLGTRSSTAAAARAPGRETPSQTPSLGAYTIDLTAEAAAGRIDPIRGRSREIRQVIDILTRRRQNNPILVGDAGVGKTAIVEGFARRVAAEDVPSALRDISVRILDLGLLQAGAGIKGEFEERLKKVIDEVRTAPRPVILFVDEAHNLIGAGGAAGQGDAANLLKPALARGEVRTIAATTWAEYKKYFEKDPALTRRFQLVRVDEPEEEAAVDMLRAVAVNLADHHGVRIRDEAVRSAVRLSARYLSERRLPDSAISVLDTACARVALALDGTPPAVEELDRRLQPVILEIEALERERATGEDHGEAVERLQVRRRELEGERAALSERWERELEVVGEILELEAGIANGEEGTDSSETDPVARLAGLVEEYERLAGAEPLVPRHVDTRVVTSVISGWTGIPVGRMLADEIQGVLSLEERMAERLVGQPQALSVIARRISTTRAELDDPSKPQGVFLLVGPSGVGKTETAIVLSDLLYGGSRNMVSLNMSEFQEGHSVATLKGSPPGYVGYGEGGVLTEAVRRRPYSVVLLDEAEKAHGDVMQLFYQVFDKGTLEDGEGVPVDFRNTILLLTTNLASEVILDACSAAAGGERPSPGELTEAVRSALVAHFRPALLGRLVVVPYYPLEVGHIRAIVRLKLEEIRRRIRERHVAELTWDDAVVEDIAARSGHRDTGARNVDFLLGQTLLPELSAELLGRMAEGASFTEVHVSLGESGGLAYRVEG